MTKSLSFSTSLFIISLNIIILGLTSYFFFDAFDCLVFSISFFGLFQIYGICRYLLQGDDEKEWNRKRAWILTFFSAFGLVIQCFDFLRRRQVFPNLFLSPNISIDILYLSYLSPNEGKIAVLYFAAHCMLDLLVGVFDYHENLGLITGFLHHTAFILFLPLTLYSHIEGAFLLLCLNEIPTLILSLGQMFRLFRQDLLVGISFFLIRVIYTLTYTLLVVIKDTNEGKPYLLTILLPICILHIIWFRDWYRGYSKRIGKGKGKRGDGDGDTNSIKDSTISTNSKEIVYDTNRLNTGGGGGGGGGGARSMPQSPRIVNKNE
jgi:hypothetical protein